MNDHRPIGKPATLMGVGLLTLSATLLNAAAAPDSTALVDANNAFACDLYARLKSADGNLCFSPYSISSAFSMTWCGARGETAEQMARALHFEAGAAETTAGLGGLQHLLNDVQTAGAVQLAIANSLWLEKTYPLRPDFLALLDKHFQASVSACGFRGQPEAERMRINRWVEAHTNQRIKDLLPEGSVTPMTRLVLANAVYFKGKWAEQFQTSQTRREPFFIQSENQVQVSMMTQKASFAYAKPAGLQVLAMPYAGGELSMVVLLPEAKDGLQHLEDELSAERMKEWTDHLRPVEIIVHFPRFTVESSFGLNQTMQALGMREAFSSGRADFSGISDRGGLFISDAVHKAFVEVNEEGTEAAAATGLAVRATSVQPMPLVFRADHRFLYLIRHNATGTILFMGRMVDPSK